MQHSKAQILSDKLKAVYFYERILYLLMFYGSMLVATIFVSVILLGKYTIAYQPDTQRIIFSFLCLVILAIALPAKVNSVDRMLVWLLVLFSGVPILIPYAVGGADTEWMLVSLLFWVLVAFQSRINFGKAIIFPNIKGAWILLVVFFMAVALYSLFTAVYSVGLTFTFDFSQVYEVRDEFLDKQIPFGNYAYKWSVFIIAPLLFFTGLWSKKIILMCLGLLIALILFFATGHKTYLLAVPFVFGLYWFLKRKNPAFWICMSFSLMILSGIASFNLTGDARLNASFLNRIFVLPAKISYEYHDFFTNNDKIYLSHSILSPFSEYPYDEHPAVLIAETYYENPEGYPNTGMVADAFMNFGYIGVCILFVFVTLVFRLIKSLSLGKSDILVLSMLTMPIYSWVNSGFFTSFLTSGLALSILGIWLLPKNSN